MAGKLIFQFSPVGWEVGRASATDQLASAALATVQIRLPAGAKGYMAQLGESSPFGAVGERVVDHVLDRTDMICTISLLGVAKIADLNRSLLDEPKERHD